MRNRKLEAEILRRGIDLGLYSFSDAVQWSDNLIATDNVPDSVLIDLSLSSKPQDVVRNLGSIPGSAEPSDILAGLFRKMLRTLSADDKRAEDLARYLFKLVHDDEWKYSGIDENEAYYIDDGFDLAASGAWGTRDEAVAELRQFLEEHAASEQTVP